MLLLDRASESVLPERTNYHQVSRKEFLENTRVNKREDMLYLRNISSTEKLFLLSKVNLIVSKLCEVQNPSDQYENEAQKIRKFHQSLITITLFMFV